MQTDLEFAEAILPRRAAPALFKILPLAFHLGPHERCFSMISNRIVLTSIVAGCMVAGFGCETATRVVDSQLILGRWKGAIDEMEFCSDGDLKVYALLRTNHGKWKMLSDKRIALEVPGVVWGTWNPEFRYTLDGNTLVLSVVGNESVTLEYTKK